MSASTTRSFRSALALPLFAVALPAALTLSACGNSSTSSSSPTTSMSVNTTTVPSSTDTGTSTGTLAPASTATVSTTTTVTASTAASRPTATGSASTGHTGTTSVGVLDLTDLGTVAFATPSGRIQCSDIRGTELRCDVEGVHWAPAAGTAKCDLDEGDSVYLPASGAAALTCHGDSVIGSPEVGRDGTSWHTRPGGITVVADGHTVAAVTYGTTVHLPDGLTCISRTSGLSCSNGGGHSFTISQQGYRVS